MTRANYVAFAALFRGEMAAVEYLPTRRNGERHRVRGIILSTADIFAQDNPRFDRGTFYLASGLTEDGFFQ